MKYIQYPNNLDILLQIFLNKAKNDSNCDTNVKKEQGGGSITRYSNKSDNFLDDGFMFIIVENTMDDLRFIEKGEYTGSSGLTRVGDDPNNLDYELNASPDQSVQGIIFKIALAGFGTSARVSEQFQQVWNFTKKQLDHFKMKIKILFLFLYFLIIRFYKDNLIL